MEKSKIVLQTAKSDNEGTQKKGIGSNLLRSIISIIVIMIFSMTLLTSCFWGYHRGHGHEEMERHDDHGDHGDHR